ncbi:MAG: NAD(P)-binding domain-containing protein [Bacteriovoracia bacterium]
MKISIIGLGHFGAPLARSLQKSGHKIAGTTRTLARKNILEKEIAEVELLNYPEIPGENLRDSEVMILNIPPFPEQLDWFKSWDLSKDTWIIFISSTSGKKVLLEEEEWISSHFNRWTILRFGGLIGHGRHPGKHLSGKTNLPGKLWPVNLIHLDDCIDLTQAVIDKKIQNEIYSVVSGDHPTREDYYSDYCRRHSLPLPQFDQNDLSTKETISNEKVLRFYPNFRSIRNS